MARDPRPAVVLLRMSPQLRDGLRAAADDAGCSLNAFAVQVLAAAAGDPGRFRAERANEEEAPELERDARGYPTDRQARAMHIGARTDFMGTMQSEKGAPEMVALVNRYDKEDPGYFVEWQRLKEIERAAAEREGHRGVA